MGTKSLQFIIDSRTFGHLAYMFTRKDIHRDSKFSTIKLFQDVITFMERKCGQPNMAKSIG